MTSAVWQNIRYAVRMLRKNPGFTAIAVLTLALGVGANTAIFSVVNAAILRPLPVDNPERLMILFAKVRDANDNPVSYADFADWRKQNQSFESMTAFFSQNRNLTGTGEPERLRVAGVTERYFETLGVPFHLGRSFSGKEHEQGANLVAVIGYGFWQQRFGGSPSVLGQVVRLDDKNYTVIGVTPANMPNVMGRTKAEIFVPLEPSLPSTSWQRRGLNYLTVLARLKPGVTVTQAQSELDLIAERLQTAYPEQNQGVGIRVSPLQRHLFGDLRFSLITLLAAVGFVLLIATSNVANLLLARGVGRTKEFAVRLAVGASRSRLILQMLTESLVLALIAGVLGIGLAVWMIDLLVALWPAKVIKPDLITLDWTVLSFTAAVTVMTGILFGIIPAWQATRLTLNESLKDTSGKTTSSSGRIRNWLVISQTALATLLLLGSGLMIRSFWLARHVDPGFNPESLISIPITLPASKYKDDTAIAAFFRQSLDSIAALPDVEAVGAINNLPLAGGGMSGTFRIGGRDFPAGQEPETEKFIVSADYFRTMSIRLISGRHFTEHDTSDKPQVVILNETMARRFWPNQDPVGQRVAWGDDWQEIVGVVGDVKHEGLELESGLQSYAPASQSPSIGMTFVVRTKADPSAVLTAIKGRVHEIDRNQPLLNAKTFDQILAESVSPRRLWAFLLGAFAGLALLLSAIGIYGVMAYSVTQRTHEIGVRRALGAQTRDVLRLILGAGMKLALIGVALGIAGAFALMRLLTKLLFGVAPTDALTFISASGLLLVVALVACYLPARRAAKVDPLVALRYE